MISFQEFIKNHINEECNIKLEKVDVLVKQNTWVLHFNVNNLIPVNLFKNFYNALVEYLGEQKKIKIDYKFNFTINNSSLLEQYYDFLYERLLDKHGRLSILSNFNFELKDNTITYFIDENSVFLDKKFNQCIVDTFKDFGFDVKIIFNVD